MEGEGEKKGGRERGGENERRRGREGERDLIAEESIKATLYMFQLVIW